MEASHAPDDSNVAFDIRQCNSASDDYSCPYSRSNTLEFLKPAREIADFLLSCLGNPKMNDSEWDTLSEKLVQGFLTPLKDPNELSAHWGKIFPGVAFYYDPITVLDSMLTISAEALDERAARRMEVNDLPGVAFEGTDKFFRFNVLADKSRVRIVGEEFLDLRAEKLAKECTAI